MKFRKSIYLLLSLVFTFGFLVACGNLNGSTEGETRIYQSENGPVRVPKNPKRVAVLMHTYTGNLMQLGITPIAITQWPKGSKILSGKLKDAEVISEDSVEKLMELKPDLIITSTDDKNIKKYEKIAPTVALTYTKYDYLEQHIEIGKIVGKEKEAREWVEKWKKRVAEEKKKVQAAIGKDATVTVLQTLGKEIYVFGKNWGRGTEVIYQALEIKAPEKLKKDVFGPGYKSISVEAIPQYAGDYIFVGQGSQMDNSFMETDVWKNIPAVKNNRVIFYDAESYYFNDPITLEHILDFVVKELTKLGKK